MLAALTGTPGTGKATASDLLREKGIDLCRIEDLATSCGALGDYDPETESREVNLELLGRSIPEGRPLILVGHLSHLLPVDIVVALRCHPEILRRRLEKRGWESSKIQENVEAEALGVICQEALVGAEAFEIDTTDASPDEVVRAILLILKGEGEKYRAGKVDWSQVILSWY